VRFTPIIAHKDEEAESTINCALTGGGLLFSDPSFLAPKRKFMAADEYVSICGSFSRVTTATAAMFFSLARFYEFSICQRILGSPVKRAF
jgi:hypothetical protein